MVFVFFNSAEGNGLSYWEMKYKLKKVWQIKPGLHLVNYNLWTQNQDFLVLPDRVAQNAWNMCIYATKHMAFYFKVWNFVCILYHAIIIFVLFSNIPSFVSGEACLFMDFFIRLGKRAYRYFLVRKEPFLYLAVDALTCGYAASLFPVSLHTGNLHKSYFTVGWVGLWGFFWWAQSAKRKDHHGVSFGWSSVWHRSNTGLSI